MDSFCKSMEIKINAANNDARVRRAVLVKLDEVLAIEGDEHSFLGNCIFQNFVVWNPEVRSSRVMRCQTVMSQIAKCFHCRRRKVFVGV
jgi:hypothetical protein